MTGYIVIGSGASELGNYPDGPKEGILLSGNYATVFASRETALRAIARTQKYEQEHGHDWKTEFMHVLPLKKFAVPAIPKPVVAAPERPAKDEYLYQNRTQKKKPARMSQSEVEKLIRRERRTCQYPNCTRTAFYMTSFFQDKAKHFCEKHKACALEVLAPKIA